MSLNKFTTASYDTPKPWMDIRCNTLSFGDSNGKVKTQAFFPAYAIGLGTITNSTPLYYTCDHTSLRMKGFLNFTSAATPHNNFSLNFSLPGELVPRFGTGSLVIATGNVCEYPTNSNTNNGQIAYGELNITGDGIDCQVFWNNGDVSTAFPSRIYVDVCLFKQG